MENPTFLYRYPGKTYTIIDCKKERMKIRRKQTMNVINYQKELDKTIVSLQKEGRVPKLFAAQLLCAVQQLCIEYLSSILKSRYFIIIRTFIRKVNIQKRILEQQELISRMNLKHPVSFLAGN